MVKLTVGDINNEHWLNLMWDIDKGTLVTLMHDH